MKRRHFLPALAAPALLAVPPESHAVTITGMEVFQIPVNRRGDWLLVRLQTSAGLTGIGEASHGRDAEATKMLAEFFPLVKGRTIFSVEHLRAQAWKRAQEAGRPGACALSAIEQALFDLAGQALGIPCYDLFGGALRPRIWNYANINRSTDPRTPEGFAAMAKRAVDAGFDAIKMAPLDHMPRQPDAATRERVMEEGLAAMRAVRDAIGPARHLLVDAHSHFDLESGRRLLSACEPLNLFWLEEVTPPKPPSNLATINREAKMPTAGGESIFGLAGFYEYIRNDAVDIAMPDVKYCGGMQELKAIAAFCHAAGVPVSPHGPASPVGNFAAAHVCATMPNFLILEYGFGETDWRQDLVEPAERIENGHLALTSRPGLGIRLNDKLLEGRRTLAV
ncbi:MAG: mandelate racemase/muconate lactonizing enzyme family protein [Bryobacterales bacterium]|nr:mandelate racemase/muconate lactonizing enzyme family protein [Bryobacterales bacterium]